MPSTLFVEPITLIPISLIDEWIEHLSEFYNKPDLLLDLEAAINISSLNDYPENFILRHNLSATTRRINNGVTILQSGLSISVAKTGHIAKWVVNHEVDVSVNESIRWLILLVKVLRLFSKDKDQVINIRIKGNKRNRSRYEDYFGCHVEWGAKMTEVWFKFDLLLAKLPEDKQRASKPIYELDQLLNMPSVHDEIKVIGQVINFHSAMVAQRWQKSVKF